MSRKRYTDDELLADIRWAIENRPYGITLTAVHKHAGGSRQRVKQLLEQLCRSGRIDRQPRDVERPELGEHYVWNFNETRGEAVCRQCELRPADADGYCQPCRDGDSLEYWMLDDEEEEFELRNDPPARKPQTFHGNERTLQKVLIDGLDCLPDQQDLF